MPFLLSTLQAAEVKRMMEYADARVEHLAAKYEVRLGDTEHI
jgi:hypothetical protein